MARFVSFLALIAILVVIAAIFVRVMAGFFVPLFLAALLGVVVQPLYRWTLLKCHGYRHVAAGISTAVVALIVLLPIGVVVTTATLEGISLIDRLQLADVREKLDQLRGDLGLQIPCEQDVRHTEATLHAWREKQRHGEPLDVQTSQIENLLARVRNIKAWITENEDEGPEAEPSP